MPKDDELTYSMPKEMFEKFYNLAVKEYPLIENLIQHHAKGHWRADVMMLLCEYYVVLDSLVDEFNKTITVSKKMKKTTDYYFSSLQATKVMLCLDTVEEYKQKLSESNISVNVH